MVLTKDKNVRFLKVILNKFCFNLNIAQSVV